MVRSDAPALGHAASGLVQYTTVDVWHAGEAVAHNVPVGEGRDVRQVDQDVPERVTATLPRSWEGAVLDPASQRGVLGCDGHEIDVTVHLQSVDGRRWTQRRGRFQVQDWSRDGAHIAVTADGLLRRIKDHHAPRPRGVAAASPIPGELMKLVAVDGFDTYVHPSLPTRSVPAGFVFGEDRFASLTELVTAWPARVRVDEWGRVCFLPPLDDELPGPVVTWTDGVGGTVVHAPVEGSRQDMYNHLLVHAKPEGEGEEQVVEYRVDRGRMAGQHYGWITRRIQSDAITTTAQAQLVAINEAARAGLRSRVIPVDMAPDWRVELDDPARVVTAQTSLVGRVTGLDMPLTPGDGLAHAHIGVIG